MNAQCELQAKDNMLFASTAIANGSCTAVITSTGMNVRALQLRLMGLLYPTGLRRQLCFV